MKPVSVTKVKRQCMHCDTWNVLSWNRDQQCYKARCIAEPPCPRRTISTKSRVMFETEIGPRQ